MRSATALEHAMIGGGPGSPRSKQVRELWHPTGLTIATRARFGFRAGAGSSDDGRFRQITQHLPPTYAACLFTAQEQGATEQQLQNIAAEGLQEVYFKDRARRADGLLVELTDIDYIGLDF
jgi:hypothetical protein